MNAFINWLEAPIDQYTYRELLSAALVAFSLGAIVASFAISHSYPVRANVWAHAVTVCQNKQGVWSVEKHRRSETVICLSDVR